jgi:hypothetical protein
MIESLRKKGVKEEIISSVIAEAQGKEMEYYQKTSSREARLAIR